MFFFVFFGSVSFGASESSFLNIVGLFYQHMAGWFSIYNLNYIKLYSNKHIIYVAFDTNIHIITTFNTSKTTNFDGVDCMALGKYEVED